MQLDGGNAHEEGCRARTSCKAAHNVTSGRGQEPLRMNDPTMQRKRGRMMLPAPQISEAELEVIALPQCFMHISS